MPVIMPVISSSGSQRGGLADVWQCLGVFWVVWLTVPWHLVIEASDARHPAVCSAAPTARSFLIHDVGNAEVEKPSFRGSVLKGSRV